MVQPKIIVIDDSPSTRAIARAGFERAGFLVFDAGNENAAIRIILDERPDIVLLDLFMPKFPTAEFISQLKKMREGWGWAMTILIYSGRSSTEIREVAASYEVDGYIQKMLGIRQCVESVRARISPSARTHQ